VQIVTGVDLVEVARIEQMLAQHGERFLRRVFTTQELADCGTGRGRCMHLAARFAAKEAGMKALGTGLASGITWQDVEVIRQATGAPLLRLHGRASDIAQELGVVRWTISLTHTKQLAIAMVVGAGAG
jgi:holo-[acyl-carrier protein] synthase